MEKFVTKKAKRFLDNQNLVLPGIELIYVWNAFTVLDGAPHLLENVSNLVRRERKALESKKGKITFLSNHALGQKEYYLSTPNPRRWEVSPGRPLPGQLS